MQSASDIMLGWLKVTGIDGQQREFYLRQLWDWKRSAEIETFGPADLQAYGRMCGFSLALGHARSGDALALAGYLGRGATFDLAIATFADAYADQNQRDYDLMRAAAAAGKIEVVSDL